MNPILTFDELKAQADAMLQALTAQRDAALSLAVQLRGDLAILEARLKVANSPSVPPPVVPTVALADGA